MCKKRSENQLSGAYICYVNRPSGCYDLRESRTNPEYQISAQACQDSEFLQNTASNTTMTLHSEIDSAYTTASSLLTT